MSEDTTGQSTAVTRLDKKKEPGAAQMSFTAVSTHQAMADAFVKELLRLGKKIMPDRDLSVEDLVSICHTAMDGRERGVVMLEGRHLRGRIGEQLSRAERYKESFSIFVIELESMRDTNSYDAVVDTLCERMRKTDLMFLFKYRVVLILPHTKHDGCEILSHRIRELLGSAMKELKIQMSFTTYPSDQFEKGSDVLDWAEDKIRT